MRRTILISFVIIGAALAVVFGGASSFAPFTDTATGSGAVAAGELDLLVDLQADDVFDIAFTTGALCEQLNLAPNDVCGQTLSVTNGGTLSFTYTMTFWADDNGVDNGATGPTGDTLVNCINVYIDEGNANASYATITANGSSISDAPAAAGYPGADTSDLAPADTAMEWRLNVTVDDSDACQNASATILGRVEATQSATPHD